jgi:acyl carrier protein
VLRCTVERVLPDRPLRTLGLDSLMALEFRNRLERGLRLKLSATLAWNYPTVTALAAHLEAKLAALAPTGPNPKPDSKPDSKPEPKLESAVLPDSGRPSAQPSAKKGPPAFGQPADLAEPSAAELLEAELLGAQSLLSKYRPGVVTH